jgi:beta-glucuronidase
MSAAIAVILLLASPAPTATVATPTPPAGPSVPLYPDANEFREVLDLSGLWDFKLDPRDEGERSSWFRRLRLPRRDRGAR